MSGYAIKNAIGNNGNISVNLALTLFHKQISPVLLYGCSIWSPPNLNHELNIFTDLKWFANRQIKCILDNLTNKSIEIESSSIDRAKNLVTVKLKSWEDKMNILHCHSRKPGTYIIEEKLRNNVIDQNHDIDKLQTKYLKYAIGVSKHTNNSAIYTELKQSPISLKAYRLAMLYHYRLENEIENDNVLLKEAYKTMKDDNHPWIDSISWLYAKSGMTNLFKNIKMFRKNYVSQTIARKFTDIFIQENQVKLGNKEHFRELKCVIEHHSSVQNSYLNKINTPSIQKTFSKLRLNNTKLTTGPYQSISNNCNNCNCINGTKHLIFECSLTNNTKRKFFERIRDICPTFQNLQQNEQFIRVLNLDFSNLSCTDEQAVYKAAISFICDVYRILPETVQK